MNPTSSPTVEASQASQAPRARGAMNGVDMELATSPHSAAQRLEQSRLHLQRALAPEVPVTHQQPQRQTYQTQHAEHLQRCGASPTGAPPAVVQHLLARARIWWSSHPLHQVGSLAVHAAEAAARPMVRQHPVALLLAAAACGVVVAWARPWRFLNRRIVAAVLVPGVLPGLMRYVTPLLVPLLLPRVGPSMWARLVRAVGSMVPGEYPVPPVQPAPQATPSSRTTAQDNRPL